MAEKIYEDDELLTIRFPCGCLWAGHSFDISLELADDGRRVVECSLNLYMDGKSAWKYRLKQIWNLLKGEDGTLADFIIRTEDIPQIINLLSRVIPPPYTSTSGTTKLDYKV